MIFNKKNSFVFQGVEVLEDRLALSQFGEFFNPMNVVDLTSRLTDPRESPYNFEFQNNNFNNKVMIGSFEGNEDYYKINVESIISEYQDLQKTIPFAEFNFYVNIDIANANNLSTVVHILDYSGKEFNNLRYEDFFYKTYAGYYPFSKEFDLIEVNGFPKTEYIDVHNILLNVRLLDLMGYFLEDKKLHDTIFIKVSKAIDSFSPIEESGQGPIDNPGSVSKQKYAISLGIEYRRTDSNGTPVNPTLIDELLSSYLIIDFIQKNDMVDYGSNYVAGFNLEKLKDNTSNQYNLIIKRNVSLEDGSLLDEINNKNANLFILKIDADEKHQSLALLLDNNILSVDDEFFGLVISEKKQFSFVIIGSLTPFSGFKKESYFEFDDSVGYKNNLENRIIKLNASCRFLNSFVLFEQNESNIYYICERGNGNHLNLMEKNIVIRFHLVVFCIYLFKISRKNQNRQFNLSSIRPKCSR